MTPLISVPFHCFFYVISTRDFTVNMEQDSEVHNKQNNDDVVHKIPSLLKNFHFNLTATKNAPCLSSACNIRSPRFVRIVKKF